MKRRSFIQGLAAIFGAGAVLDEIPVKTAFNPSEPKYASDVVYNISPTETPFASLKRHEVVNRRHAESGWVVDKL
jgi:hypothetical protein